MSIIHSAPVGTDRPFAGPIRRSSDRLFLNAEGIMRGGPDANTTHSSCGMGLDPGPRIASIHSTEHARQAGLKGGHNEASSVAGRAHYIDRDGVHAVAVAGSARGRSG